MQILAIGLFIGGMTQGPIALLHAAGRPDITACWHFAELPLYLGTLLLLTYKWGIQGAAVALVVRVAADYVVLGVASSRLVRQVGPSVRRLSVATALGVAALVSLACIGPLHFRLILGGVYLLGFVVIIYSRPSRNEKAKWLWRAWAVARS
jgi:O-antigen/teichoic acid export membrane protein